MRYRLLAGRWNGTLGAETIQVDSAMLDPQDVGIRWSLENFGTQRIEVTVKAKNKFDAYDRYANHLGQRLGVYSNWCFRPITGFITSVEFAGANRIKYVAKGPYSRMETELDTTIYSDTLAIGGSAGAIATILSNMPTRIDDTTTSNIATNTSTLAGYNPKFPQGSYPIDLIKEILDLSDTSNNIYDFWLVDQPLKWTTLQKWTPYYQARSASASFDWQVDAKDLSNQTLKRDIDDSVTDTNVYYARHTGTHDGGNNASVLTDSGEDFLAQGITPGDSITNITDGSRGQVESLTATTITPTALSGGTDNDFDTGDKYAIDIKNVTSSRVQTASATAKYWKREKAVFERQFNSTQASQYANALLETDAVQTQAFTVGAHRIQDGKGIYWPLWEVIAQGAGYIRVNDLYPAALVFGTTLNNLSTFRIVALDYKYSSNQLRIMVDRQDRRLDVRLRRQGIINSEGIFVT